MSLAFFTTAYGDAILRAGREPGSRHDFRVHKFLLYIAPPVFKDMFTSSQPPEQNDIRQPIVPIFDVPYSSEVLMRSYGTSIRNAHLQ